MSYRNPLEVFHFDKPFLEQKDVRGALVVTWVKGVKLPQGTLGWRIHNRGAFDIRYAYQDNPIKWEVLEADVADSKSYIPRHIWLANDSLIVGNNSLVYIEYWVAETEGERKDGESGIYQQLLNAFEVFKRHWRRRL